MTKSLKIRIVTVTAIMSAFGFVLMMLEISVPFMPVFIKFDFSELPALITAFAYGPISGILVCLIKNLLHLFFTGTMGIGELANFLMGAVFVGVAGVIYKYRKNRSGALIGSIIGSLIMSFACIFINYFITYPIYSVLLMPSEVILSFYKDLLPSVNSLFAALMIFNLPFTFFKGVVDTVICLLIYKKLSPILKKGR